MSASSQLAVYLPYILAGLLVGAALLGSLLPRARKPIIERNVLKPAYLLLLLAYLAVMLQRHDWLMSAFAVVVAAVVSNSWYRRSRRMSEESST
jgi:hypothetical protein